MGKSWLITRARVDLDDLDPWAVTTATAAGRTDGCLVVKGYVVDPTDLPILELLNTLPGMAGCTLPQTA